MNSAHADQRAQQRCIPPFINQLLDLYGREEFDGNGHAVVFLDKKCVRHMERDMGREPVRKLSHWLTAYKVLATDDGTTITIGYRTKHLRRK